MKNVVIHDDNKNMNMLLPLLI